MTRWKEKSFEQRQQQQQSSDKDAIEEEDEDELDLDYSDINNTSMNAHLLFTKESLKSATGSGPLFSSSSRKSFLIMTCKRTMFACRGLFLFCFLVFLVISVVASYNNDRDDEDDNSGSSVGVGVTVNSGVNNGTIKYGTNYLLTSIPLPFHESYLASGGKVTQVEGRLNTNCSFRKGDYAAIGNSIRRGVEFYEKNKDNITVLDAALGTKIVAEQIRVIKQLHPSLPVEITSYLDELGKRADVVTEEITATVKRTSNSTADLKYTLPWLETKDLWDLPLNGTWYEVGRLASYNPPYGESFEDLWEIAAHKEAIDEFVSDACIYQVFHCSTVNITGTCEDAFLNSLGSMYSLTHQVIYMLVAQKTKCFEEEAWREVSGVEDNGQSVLERMCGKVWQEANSISESNFPPKFRDLLIEQIGMCSLSGYTDFLRRDWLRRLLSWQAMTTSGCFGQRRRRIPTIGMLLKDYEGRQRGYEDIQSVEKDWDDEGEMAVTGSRSHHYKKRRYKRSDMFVQDSTETCSVHFTSVGITALSIYLRYFFDTCLDAY